MAAGVQSAHGAVAKLACPAVAAFCRPLGRTFAAGVAILALDGAEARGELAQRTFFACARTRDVLKLSCKAEIASC